MTALTGRTAALACGLLLMAVAAMPATSQQAPAATPAAAPATEDARLAAFFEEVFQRSVKDSPIFQAYLGMKGPDYGKWNDFSDEEAQRQDALNKQDLVRLRAEFDFDKLSEPMKISYRIFEVQTQSSIDTFPWRFHGYAFQTQTNPIGQAATFMQNIHSVDSVADAEAYVSRLNGRAEGDGTGHRRHERSRAPRHRADVLLLRSRDRRRPQRDHRRAV